MAFNFEKLEVYQDSIFWVKEANGLCDAARGKLPKTIIDQLTRAALSVPLNIAEAHGRWHIGERRQFFRIARGSVFECVPILQILKESSLIDSHNYECNYNRLEKMSKMISSLIKALEGVKR